ncbi:MAG: TBC domain-containing protein [archaeon]|nr:TBC domain-containing protein [archaeon]
MDMVAMLRDITPELIDKWESTLMNKCSEYTKLTEIDKNIDDYDLTYSDIKTIKNDCDRTRIKECEKFPDFGKLLSKLLVYYCKLNSIDYKQGMNEIMGPLILLKLKIDISVPKILNLFSLIVDKFLTNYYHERELYAFKSSVSLLTLLLKYHDPELFLIFEHSGITPQMYATNWLLTTHANKHNLYIVYKFWDILIEEGDQLFIHFMVIAFLQFFRKRFIESDFSMIPLFFSKLTIETEEQLIQIVKSAKDIRDKTPYSFRILVNKLQIFKPRSRRLRELFEKYNTENMLALPILPSEILFNFYLSETKCVDNQCKYFLKDYVNDNEQECYYCKNKLKLFRKNYFVIDMRTFEKTGFKNSEGKLEGVEPFFEKYFNQSPDKPLDKSVLECISDEIINRHIILLTGDTSYFDEYEQKFFKERVLPPGSKYIVGYMSLKNEKEIDYKAINEEKKKDKSNELETNLKEYRNLKDLIALFVRNKTTFVSFALGGFKSIHEICLKYNIKILNHNENLCDYCRKAKGKNEQIECYSKLFSKPVNNQYQDDNENDNEPTTFSDLPVIPQTEVFENDFSSPNKPGNDNFMSPKTVIEGEQVTEYLSNSDNKIFHCLLLEHNMFKLNEKVMMIFFLDCVRIVKMKIKGKSMSFDVIDIIQFNEFKTAKQDVTIFEVYYIHDDGQNRLRHDLKLDFFTDADAVNFKETITKVMHHK